MFRRNYIKRIISLEHKFDLNKRVRQFSRKNYRKKVLPLGMSCKDSWIIWGGLRRSQNYTLESSRVIMRRYIGKESWKSIKLISPRKKKFPFCEQFKKLVFEKRLVSTRLSTDYNVQWLATVKIHFFICSRHYPSFLHHHNLTLLSMSYKFLCSSFFYVFDFISWPLKLFLFPFFSVTKARKSRKISSSLFYFVFGRIETITVWFMKL